jgi:hypothetical protein
MTLVKDYDEDSICVVSRGQGYVVKATQLRLSPRRANSIYPRQTSSRIDHTDSSPFKKRILT